VTFQRFAGKVALVTGGSMGIGAAIADRLAAEGARVAICGRRLQLLEEKAASMADAGHDVIAVQGDVATEADEIVEQVVGHFGRLDVLVNNAAVAVGLGIDEMTPGAWRHVMSINLDGAFALVAAALPHLVATRGNVLHVSSIGAVAGNFDDLAYVASKAGLEGLSRKLALEMAEYGVRSNVIRPGLVLTEAFSAMPADFFETQVPLIPVGRIGQPDDIAGAAAFLCSDEASFITGATLTIDGGESAK
jgi:NAD(P)-dependent dehydrogenase (short-subunit alcohol dehydrogenase family)